MMARCCDENEMGIKFEYTAPGTPQQNRVVERVFVTLIGRGRAVKNYAGFTVKKRQELWCEAAQTAMMLDSKMENHLIQKFYGEDPKYMQSISEPL